VNNEVKKVLFIVNKYAGTGYQPELEGRILDACEQQEAECTIEFTQSRGHATELAREAEAKGFSRVIAVGGDGTVNEVAQGLLHSPIHMGIIPRGSGNGLARHLGIPIKMTHALTSLFTSEVITMDTFSVNGALSLNVSGIGFDGHVANLFGKDKKRGLGGYVKITISEFIRFKELEATFTIDGKKYDRHAFIIAIANSSQYGNNARIAPSASVCDELLNITLLKKVPPYRMDFVYDFFTGKINNSKYCEVFEGKNISIQLKEPIAFHVDGEPSGLSDFFDIKINAASLKMLAPPSAKLRL
jgi:YegS/Rv2252/BmrU family lipid kinase